jgi:pimeloyl-ACP methyl ester carboxylesterase
VKNVSIGDVELAVEERGRGLPLLLVHGFPLASDMWAAQIDALSAEFRVIAPDLRGFGQSRDALRDTAADSSLTMDRLADDLHQLLAALDVDEPVVFCGLSMGGYIAWQFWQKYAERLRALILCDTRSAADTPEARRDRLRMADGIAEWGARSVAAAMSTKLFSPLTHQHQPELVTQVRQTIATTDPRTIAAAQRGMAERPDMTAILGEIKLPTLVVVGCDDLLSPPAEMQAIAEAIPGAQFVEVPEAGHLTPMENAPAVNAAIRRFLSS